MRVKCNAKLMMSECYFANVFWCADSGKDLVKAGHERIKKIINSSKLQDNTYLELEGQLANDETLVIHCHRNYVSTYTSSTHIKRHQKRIGETGSSSEPPPVRRTRRSHEKHFDFRENCLFCGEVCLMSPDPKNQSRWRKAILRRTANRPGRHSFKEAIYKMSVNLEKMNGKRK